MRLGTAARAQPPASCCSACWGCRLMRLGPAGRPPRGPSSRTHAAVGGRRRLMGDGHARVCACHTRRLLWSRRQISCAGPNAGTPHAQPVASSAVSGVALSLLMRHRGPSRRRRVRSSRARLRRGCPAVVLSGHTHSHTQVSAPSILGLGFIMRFGDFLNSI